MTKYRLYEVYADGDPDKGCGYNGGDTLEEAINVDWKKGDSQFRQITRFDPKWRSNLEYYQRPDGDVIKFYHVDEYEIKHGVKTFRWSECYETIEEARIECTKRQEENPKGRKRIYRVWEVRENGESQ